MIVAAFPPSQSLLRPSPGPGYRDHDVGHHDRRHDSATADTGTANKLPVLCKSNKPVHTDDTYIFQILMTCFFVPPSRFFVKSRLMSLGTFLTSVTIEQFYTVWPKELRRQSKPLGDDVRLHVANNWTKKVRRKTCHTCSSSRTSTSIQFQLKNNSIELFL